MLPKLTIGLPVRNGEKTLRLVIENILNQTFRDFQLIISDNCSIDSTSNICKEYQKKDSRIIFFSHKKNIGGAKNFKYVFSKAKTEYFCWAAADDLRSNNFLEDNINFLEHNLNYVASASPNRFDNDDSKRLISFDIVGSLEKKIKIFFGNCWNSHGIFYAIFRRKDLIGCDALGKDFFGMDWAINLFLIKKGNIHRSKNSYIIFGSEGTSRANNSWKYFRVKKIEWIFPFFVLNVFIYNLIKDINSLKKLDIFLTLLKFNTSVFFRHIYFLIQNISRS